MGYPSKQTAMGSTAQKPTQRKRFGELSEDLPGFTKGVAYVERNGQELGRPERSHRKVSRRTETSSREARCNRESDQLTVPAKGRG
jgi:hypothetical protein